jgi:RND family efflux transporter MFP subunit
MARRIEWDHFGRKHAYSVAFGKEISLKRLNFALALTVIGFGLAACQSAHETDPRTSLQFVQVATVQPAGAADRAFTGVVTARVQSNLGFRVPGKVIERLVNTGDSVRRGQALMRIDRTDLALAIAAQTAAVAAARARAVQTAADETRSRALFAESVIAAQNYDQARAAADTARAELAAAKAAAQVANDEGGYAMLAADADGVVVETLAEPGQVVAAGQTVVRLAHSGPREAAVNLPETMHPGLGSMAEATLYDGAQAESPALLRQLSNAADPQTRTFEARYVLEGDAANAPLGATVTVRIPASRADALAEVPLGAIYDGGSGPMVWILDGRTSSVSMRPVRICRFGTERATLSSGVHPGEKIVAMGVEQLYQGEHVRLAADPAIAQ